MKKIFMVFSIMMEDGDFNQQISNGFAKQEDALKAFKKMRDDAYKNVFTYYDNDNIEIDCDTKAEFTVKVRDDNFSHYVYINEIEVVD